MHTGRHIPYQLESERKWRRKRRENTSVPVAQETSHLSGVQKLKPGSLHVVHCTLYQVLSHWNRNGRQRQSFSSLTSSSWLILEDSREDLLRESVKILEVKTSCQLIYHFSQGHTYAAPGPLTRTVAVLWPCPVGVTEHGSTEVSQPLADRVRQLHVEA